MLLEGAVRKDQYCESIAIDKRNQGTGPALELGWGRGALGDVWRPGASAKF